MKTTSALSKDNELATILFTQFNGRINLARCKLMALFITGLCKIRTVSFEKLATGFNTKANTSSSLRRIQRFIASFILDADAFALLIFNLLPQRKNLRLAIDRTNWKFGSFDINIFMLGVVYDGVAIH
jgi:hypothetical protein